MIFKNKIRKDIEHRLKYLITEIDYKIYKSITHNKILPLSLRLKAFHNLKTNSNITKIRNLCIITGRSRGIVTKFGLSRLAFRKYADSGLIPGIKRATW